MSLRKVFCAAALALSSVSASSTGAQLDNRVTIANAPTVPSTSSEELNSKIFNALYEMDTDLALELLNKPGVDPNYSSPVIGYNLLGLAAVLGQGAVIDRLIDLGADVNKPAVTSGNTALILAAENGNTKAVIKLVARGAKIDQTGTYLENTPLMSVVGMHSGTAIELIKLGANVNIPDLAGRTVLMRSVEYFDIPVTRALLASGAHVDAQDRHGRNALMYAAFMGNLEAAKLLIEAKANPDLKTADGEDVFSYAAKGKQRGVKNEETAAYLQSVKEKAPSADKIDGKPASLTPSLKKDMKP